MKARPVVLGLLAAFGLAGCGANAPAPAKIATREVTLEAGVEVPLILLRQISAGSTRQGTLVPFMVAEDVKTADGAVAIPKGTIAEGEVTWSRSEGSLGGLMNQPARLAVKFNRTRGAGGETVELCANRDQPEEAYAFTRDNTGLPDARLTGELRQKLGESDVAERLDAAISGFFETGDASKLDLEADAREWLRQLIRENDMKALDDSLAKGGSDLGRVAKHIQDGSLTQLAAPDLVLAVTAMQQLGQLAHSLERGLSRTLKGRTIKAYVGTPVTAYVGKEAKVKVSSPQSP